MGHSTQSGSSDRRNLRSRFDKRLRRRSSGGRFVYSASARTSSATSLAWLYADVHSREMDEYQFVEFVDQAREDVDMIQLDTTEAQYDRVLSINLKIMRGVAQGIKDHCPSAFVIVISNPLDAMVFECARVTGFPKARVCGMAGVSRCLLDHMDQDPANGEPPLGVIGAPPFGVER